MSSTPADGVTVRPASPDPTPLDGPAGPPALPSATGSPAGTGPGREPGAENGSTDGPPSGAAPAGTGRRGSPARLLTEGWSQLPGWSQALLVYVLSRLVDVLIIGRVARFQAPSLWTQPDPGYTGMLSLWDADWYRKIAEHGYPTHLPLDSFGHIAQNEWAFYPLYPYTVRTVMRLFGTGWPVSASAVSLVCGALAVVVMRSLVDKVAGAQAALWTVILFCTFPSAPVLQLAYTEALSVLLLVAALWCLQRRQYLLAVPVLLLIGLARPIAVPVAVVAGLHVLNRLRRRREEPLGGAAGVAELVLLLVGAALASVEWTVIAAKVTGDPNGYTDTMGAWRVGHTIQLVKPWWTMSRYFLGDWVGPAVVALVVVVTAWWLTRPQARVLGADLRAWVVCYFGYLGLVLDPSTSLPRYLLLAFPFGTLLAVASPDRAYRRTLVLAFLAGQILWVAWLWRFSPPTDWPP